MTLYNVHEISGLNADRMRLGSQDALLLSIIQDLAREVVFLTQKLESRVDNIDQNILDIEGKLRGENSDDL